MYTMESVDGGNSTNYVITGSFDDVVAGIRSLFTDYHPLGYGTAVVRMYYDSRGGGRYVAEVKRYNSCE